MDSLQVMIVNNFWECRSDPRSVENVSTALVRAYIHSARAQADRLPVPSC